MNILIQVMIMPQKIAGRPVGQMPSLLKGSMLTNSMTTALKQISGCRSRMNALLLSLISERFKIQLCMALLMKSKSAMIANTI